ncbi:MAG: hypothetical protein OXG51_07405 [Gammaproteobacteria bacterium]|nr:hypothetical protein [Gammaproteobacteria bacterium]
MHKQPTPGRATCLLTAALSIATPCAADSANSPYASAGILSPADGEGLRANSGDFVVQAQVEPALRQGHRLLNGSAQGTAQASSAFPLTGVERGEHQLQLQIVDANGSIVFEGESSTFHLLRHSTLHRRPATNP